MQLRERRREEQRPMPRKPGVMTLLRSWLALEAASTVEDRFGHRHLDGPPMAWTPKVSRGIGQHLESPRQRHSPRRLQLSLELPLRSPNRSLVRAACLPSGVIKLGLRESKLHTGVRTTGSICQLPQTHRSSSRLCLLERRHLHARLLLLPHPLEPHHQHPLEPSRPNRHPRRTRPSSHLVNKRRRMLLG